MDHRFLIAFTALLPLTASAVVQLDSVNWTGTVSSRSSSISGSWIYGNVGISTFSGANAGAVFSYNIADSGLTTGYQFSVNEFVALGVRSNWTTTQTITFAQQVVNPFVFVNYVDWDTSFNFGSNNFTLLGSHNVTRNGQSIVVSSGVLDADTDGFLVRFNGTFGPSVALAFNTTSTRSSTQSFGLQVAVPEPSTYGLALGGLALAVAVAARRRGKVSK